MALYDKRGRKIVIKSITIGADCYCGADLVKFRARAGDENIARIFPVREVHADGGEAEIATIIKKALRKLGNAQHDQVKPLCAVERDAILAAVGHADGDWIQAARMLRIAKSTMFRKLSRYGYFSESTANEEKELAS